MATFTKFNSFVEALAEKKHDLGSDQLKVAMTNTAPVATNAVLADLTEIAYTNVSSRDVTTDTSVQTAGVYKLVCSALTLTASGTVPTFRYIVLYNDTAASDELVAFWDYGAAVNMLDTETFVVAFDDTDGVLTAE